MKYSVYKKIRISANQQGLALMFSLGILAVLTVIVLIYASRAGIERNVANAMFQGQQAQNMAESAFGRAILHLCGKDDIGTKFYCSENYGSESDNPVLNEEERKRLISHQSEAEIFDNTAQPEWIYIHENADDENSPIIGRIAYAGAQYARVCGNALCCGHYLFCDYVTKYAADDAFVNRIKNCTTRNCWGMVHQEWDPDLFPIMYSDGSVKNFDHDTFVENYIKKAGLFGNTALDLAGPGFGTMEEFMNGMGIPYQVGNYCNHDIFSRYFDFTKRERFSDRDCWYAGGKLYVVDDYHKGGKLSSGDYNLDHKKRDRYFHRFTLKRKDSSWDGSPGTVCWSKARCTGNSYMGLVYTSGLEDAWDQVTVRRIVESKPAHVFDKKADSASKILWKSGTNAYVKDRKFEHRYPCRYVIGGDEDYNTNGISYQFESGYSEKGHPSRVAWKYGRPYRAELTPESNPAILSEKEEVINDDTYTAEPTDKEVKSLYSENEDGYYPNQDAWNNMCIPYFKNWTDSEGDWAVPVSKGGRGEAYAAIDKRNQIVANFIGMGRGDALITDIPSTCWGLNPVYGNKPATGKMPYDDESAAFENKLCVDAHGKKSVEPTYVSVLNKQRMLNEVAVKMSGGYLGYDTKDEVKNGAGEVTHYIYRNLQMYVQFYFNVETVRMDNNSGSEEPLGRAGQLARICGSGRFYFQKYKVNDGKTVKDGEPVECTLLKDNADFLMGREITCSNNEKRYLADSADSSGVCFLRPDLRKSSNETPSWLHKEMNGAYETVNFQTMPHAYSADNSLDPNRWPSGGNSSYIKNPDSTTKLPPYAASFARVMLMIPVGDVIVKKTTKAGDLSEFYKEFDPLMITGLEMHLAVVETKGKTGTDLYNREGYDYAKMPYDIQNVTYTIPKNTLGVCKGETLLLADWQVNDPRHNGLANQWTNCTEETKVSRNSTVTLGGTNQDAELATDPAYLGAAKDRHISTAGASGLSSLAAVGKVHRAAPWQTLNFHKPDNPSGLPAVTDDMLKKGGGAYGNGDFLLLDQLNFVDRKEDNMANKTVYNTASVSFIDLNMPSGKNRDFAFELLFRGNYWRGDDNSWNKITDAQAKTLAGWLAAGAGSSDRVLNRRTDLYCGPGGNFWNFFSKAPDGSALQTDAAQENLLCRVISLTKAEKPWDVYRIYAIGQAIKDVGGKGTTIPISRRSEKDGKVTTVQAQLGKFEEGADLIEGECKLSVEMFYFQKYEQWKILTVNYETE